MQPVLVRLLPGSLEDRYEIIAGERRWRASEIAGLTEIPALVREVEDEAVAAMALIENIQREDLNALEEAVGMSRLIEEFGMTHEAVATAVGKSRASVTNLLRLLNLAEPVRDLLSTGQIDMGHARALLGLPTLKQLDAARIVVLKGLSVRETEALVHRLTQETPEKNREENRRGYFASARRSIQPYRRPVAIRHGKRGNGKVTIDYASLEDLDRLLALLR